jgi:hypothetical protein
MMNQNYMNQTELQAVSDILWAFNEILPKSQEVSLDTVALRDTNGEVLGHIHYENAAQGYVFYMGEDSPEVV